MPITRRTQSRWAAPPPWRPTHKSRLGCSVQLRQHADACAQARQLMEVGCASCASSRLYRGLTVRPTANRQHVSPLHGYGRAPRAALPQASNFEFFLAVGTSPPPSNAPLHWSFVVSGDNCSPCQGLYGVLKWVGPGRRASRAIPTSRLLSSVRQAAAARKKRQPAPNRRPSAVRAPCTAQLGGSPLREAAPMRAHFSPRRNTKKTGGRREEAADLAAIGVRQAWSVAGGGGGGRGGDGCVGARPAGRSCRATLTPARNERPSPRLLSPPLTDCTWHF